MITGYFVCENETCDPCVNRWIFSWPSAIFLLLFLVSARKSYMPELRDTLASRLRCVVKGRLRTKSDYYVINLPWRDQRPLGRFEWGGVAARIDITEIVFLK